MNSRSLWFRWNISLLVIIAFLLAACQPQQAAPPIPTLPPLTSTEQLPSTGDQPQVVVNDQKTDGASIVVAKVFSQENGWIAIHPELPDGNLGVAIGEAFVKKGSNDNVTVQLEQGHATPVMYAMLHRDTGILGKYEFPDADPPVFTGTQMINQEFQITFGKAATVEVPDQVVKNGIVKVPEVVSKGPGWLAIYTEKDEKPGDPIGFKAVQDGENKDVAVQVTQNQVTPVLYALLLTDSGVAGQFEPGSADQPQTVNSNPIQPEFRSDSEPATMFMESGGAYMQVTQAPGGPGTTAQGENTTGTQVAEATQSPSQNSTAAVAQGPAAGMVSTETATASEGGMAMNMSTTTPPTAATAGSESMNMTEVTVKPGEEPTIKVSDQPVKDGQVTVEDVVSSTPGWIAIYNSQQGQPNTLLGYSPIKEGDNPNVGVKVDTKQLTDQLFAMLHVDAGKPGVFEFPGPDALVHVDVRMIQASFMTNMAAASNTQAPANVPYVKVNDQALRNGTVTVAEVLSNGPGWIGIHFTDQNGNLGSGIGYAPLKDGLNQNVVVKIDTSKASKVMYAMLHVDKGQVGVLEFPGVDQPYKTDGNDLMSPFNVVGGLVGQDIKINVSNTQNEYLVDSQGLSLYVSLADSPGKSNCDATCRNTWLPLLATGRLVPGEGVTVNKLSVALLPNGSKQVTYGGLPVYYYIGDAKPGDTYGQGKDGQWFLITP